ncbi:MAG: BatA and WFA domain-containing protein [Planctomycetota bacterium]
MKALTQTMTTLAVISLTTPAMLLGAALVALPIAAHLLNRRTRKRVVFPSVALLSAAAASQSSVFKLRRLLLLLLRCAAVVLAVLAFARPVWLGGATASSTNGGAIGDSTAVVVVLDTSASTRQLVSNGQTAAALLRGQANRAIGRLQSGVDAGNIVFADAAPSPVFDTMTRNLAALRQAVDQSQPTDHHADFAGALTLAAELLRNHEGNASAKRVLVITDGQRSNWQELDEVNLPSDIELLVHTLGDEADLDSPGNTRLATPQVRPARPGVGTPTELSVEVARFAPGQERLRIDLLVDGQEVQSQWVRLGANQRQRVGFTHRFDTPGQHRVEYRLDTEDALSLDNTARQVVTCAGRLPVVVVGDANPDEPGTAGYYVTRALAPHNNPRDRFIVAHLAPTAVRGTSLRRAALVILGDVNGLDRVAEATLLDYIQNGGACFVFAGSKPVLNESLLPWQLVSRFGAARIADGDWQTPELRGFDVEAQDALTRAGVGRVWRTTAIQTDARVLLRYRNGQAALASQPLGAGRVMAATFSPSADSGDLGKYAVFVVLMQSLAEQLTAASDTVGQALAGLPITLVADAEVDPQGPAPRIETPTGTADNSAVFARDGDTPVATLAVADDTGFYAWRQGPATLGRAAVNLDPRESDLRPMPSDALASVLSEHGAAVAAVASVGHSSKTLSTGGTGLWGWMLLGALGLLCVEMGLLGGWRR